MKVQVSLKVQAACQAVTAASAAMFDLILSPSDTAASVKERIATVEPFAFPDTELSLNGGVLADGQRLADCGIKDGDLLELVVKACERAFAQQLEELLKVRALTPNELGLLYCHQHGVPVDQVLKALGYDDGLQAFLQRSKGFDVENGCVVAQRQEAKPQPPQPPQGRLTGIPEEACPKRVGRHIEVTASVTLKTAARMELEEVEVALSDLDTVAAAKARIAAAAMLPFAGGDVLLHGERLDDSRLLLECGVKAGSSLGLVVTASEEDFAEQLSEILKDRTLSCNELGLLYNCRHGVSVPRVLKLLGGGKDFAKFLTKQWAFIVEKGFARLDVDGPEDERYVQLLRELGSSDAAGAHACQALEAVLRALSDATFLNLNRVVRDGSAFNGTAVTGSATAEAVMVVNGLPCGVEAEGLLTSVAASLNSSLGSAHGSKGAWVADGALLAELPGSPAPVRVCAAPAFGSAAEALEVLAPMGPQASYSPLLIEQRVQFVSALPGPVKATVRLLKWWRERQQWSSEASRPSDGLLETVVAFAALGGRPAGQCASVREAMALLAHLDQLEILWPEAQCAYSLEDVPLALLEQRPLVLDPVNPFVNLADSQVFDHRELMQRAGSGLDFFQG